MTYDEHLSWCKLRAHAELVRSGPAAAVASMLSDLAKHPGHEASVRVGQTVRFSVRDRASCIRFIDGFY